MSCERGWEARALDEGRLADADVASFRRHARGCSACNTELARIEQLRALTLQLPGREPDALELRRIRARVLRDAMSTTSRPMRPVVLGAVAAVAAVLLIATAILRHWTTAEGFAATVAVSPGSIWTQTRAAGVERVVLTRGTAWLRVRRQTQGERFLVVVPDGEIEVRGTTFEVSVEGGQTTRVHVDDGIVNVKVVRGVAVLSAGQTWPALPQSAPEDSTAASSGAPAPPTSQRSPTATAAGAVPPPAAIQTLTPRAPASVAAHAPVQNAVHPESREADDYARAIETYRLGRSEEAADLFHAFTVAYPASSLLDDASFLEASSLARAGRADAAALLAERHLARFPDSFHRKAAAILVARVRRDQGNCDGARAVLKPWMRGGAPDPDVVDAVGACGAVR